MCLLLVSLKTKAMILSTDGLVLNFFDNLFPSTVSIVLICNDDFKSYHKLI